MPTPFPKYISILNPTHGGQQYTSRKNAMRYIEQGRAVPVGASAIRFVESDRRHVAAVRSAISTQTGYDRAAGTSDMDNFQLANMLRHLPCVGDVRRML